MVTRRNVELQQTREEHLASLRDYEYYLATLNPTRRYALTHEPPKPTVQTTVSRILKKNEVPKTTVSKKAKRRLRKSQKEH